VKHHPEYFDKAESWATDTQLLSLRSRRTGWTVAAVATGVAALEALALAMLVPLKSVQPITLLVDRQTGFVQTVNPDTPQRLSADEALTHSFLAQYVTAREGFDRATLNVDYRKVALLSAGAARQTYLAEMPATNPASPFRRFPSGSVVAVRIKSVSRLDATTALVRFDTQQQSPGGGVALPQPWIATVRFAFSNDPMSLEDRLVNPLGFKVLSYRRNAEAPPPPVTVPVAVRPAGYDGGAAMLVAPTAELATRPGARMVEAERLPTGSPLSSGGR
jgi:type IV secretion system protein VirB8